MLMCALCRDNEQKLQAISLAQVETRIAESIKSHDNVTEVIKLQSDYFNAHTMSFHELRKQITDEYEYACAVQSRIIHLQTVLVPNSKKQVIEFENELCAAQRILNDTVSKIQVEKRAEFSSANISYPTSTTKQPKIKIPSIKSRDPFDRLVAIYMQTMEKQGKPIEPTFESYHDGKLLYSGKDHSIAEIKAKESDGIVKTITAFEHAKQILQEKIFIK